ncbi:heavy metal translocating P-type ATPase [Amedibacterium intestinale]|uniref:heavy metal translocating P-type ATPase n=1 Tax=Amedibacterium intestinale TaxID=2583452 RepID=UPI000E4C8E19|nr:heavy metal translocating P-type ATPase [Amedibacterium intestinale]RHO28911.1 cadmium-translocating P-type ATPase [Erysipelotrichaceae bacterium AM17-60]
MEKHLHQECSHEHHHEHHHTCSCEHSHEHKEIQVHKKMEKLYITGLDCANCAAKIEEHVKHMENVKEAVLDFSQGILFVEVKDVSHKEETFQNIKEAAEKMEDGVSVQFEKTDGKEESVLSIQKNWKLFLGIILFVIAAVTKIEWLFILSYLFAGCRVLYTAVKNIGRKELFDENFLMSIATLGAFYLRDYEEAVAVMIFYEVGEMLQSYAVNSSRKSISSLMDLKSEYACIEDNGKEITVKPEEVKVGSKMLVKAGERVALDGVVVEGSTSLDTSALTGESLPQEVHAGDEVLAGSVNLRGLLVLEVTHEYKDSTVSRILELVENASSKKAPMEKFITRFAKIYTPIVVFLALALAIVPPLFIEGVEFHAMLESALTFLVVSCPCALVISIPLGLFAGIGAAGKNGVLIKGGNYLEALQKVDCVVFDKTGTLTKGSFQVVEIHAEDKEELLQLAAYAEAYSNHPIAQSIRNAYGKQIDTKRLSKYEEFAGNGVCVYFDEDELMIGNHRFMETNNINCPVFDHTGTIVYVSKNKVYLGYLVIDDEVKETSKEAIAQLKKQGVSRIVMLSGDHQKAGEALASKLELDEIYMQMLPDDKVKKVEELLEEETENGKLVFVGDGINDAPVLARADIGVAMGGIGSDAAIEAADIVLMKDDPNALAYAIHLAKETMKILNQNIAFSLGIKVLIMILAVAGYANMWMGVFADVGVALLAVLNSMRVLKIK